MPPPSTTPDPLTNKENTLQTSFNHLFNDHTHAAAAANTAPNPLNLTRRLPHTPASAAPTIRPTTPRCPKHQLWTKPTNPIANKPPHKEDANGLWTPDHGKNFMAPVMEEHPSFECLLLTEEQRVEEEMYGKAEDREDRDDRREQGKESGRVAKGRLLFKRFGRGR